MGGFDEDADAHIQYFISTWSVKNGYQVSSSRILGFIFEYSVEALASRVEYYEH